MRPTLSLLNCGRCWIVVRFFFASSFLQSLSDRFVGERQTRGHETATRHDVSWSTLAHDHMTVEELRQALELITVGRDVSSFFPDVVKCVVVDSQEVKKLVSKQQL